MTIKRKHIGEKELEQRIINAAVFISKHADDIVRINRDPNGRFCALNIDICIDDGTGFTEVTSHRTDVLIDDDGSEVNSSSVFKPLAVDEWAITGDKIPCIIRTNKDMSYDIFTSWCERIEEMAKTGTILIPPFMEVVQAGSDQKTVQSTSTEEKNDTIDLTEVITGDRVQYTVTKEDNRTVTNKKIDTTGMDVRTF